MRGRRMISEATAIQSGWRRSAIASSTINRSAPWQPAASRRRMPLENDHVMADVGHPQEKSRERDHRVDGQETECFSGNNVIISNSNDDLWSFFGHDRANEVSHLLVNLVGRRAMEHDDESAGRDEPDVTLSCDVPRHERGFTGIGQDGREVTIGVDLGHGNGHHRSVAPSSVSRHPPIKVARRHISRPNRSHHRVMGRKPGQPGPFVFPEKVCLNPRDREECKDECRTSTTHPPIAKDFVMPTSQARIDANRKNAAHSTGPTSTTGKQISRRNSLKHGLTGAGIVVLEVDAAAIEERVDEFQADLAPKPRSASSWSGRWPRSRSGSNGPRSRKPGARHPRPQRRRGLRPGTTRRGRPPPRHPGRRPPTHPAQTPQVARRGRTAHRCLGSVEGRPDSRAQIHLDAWHRERAENLAGLRIDDARGVGDRPPCPRPSGTPSAMPGPRRKGRTGNARRGSGRDGRPDRRRDRRPGGPLRDARLRADRPRPRAEAPDRALFDPSKAATLARRYESEASRRFFKAMNELREVEAEAAERPSVPATPQSSKPYVPLGSSWDRPAPAPREPQPMSSSGRPIDDDRAEMPAGRPGTREWAASGSS